MKKTYKNNLHFFFISFWLCFITFCSALTFFIVDHNTRNAVFGDQDIAVVSKIYGFEDNSDKYKFLIDSENFIFSLSNQIRSFIQN